MTRDDITLEVKKNLPLNNGRPALADYLGRLQRRGTKGKLENALVAKLGRCIVSGIWLPGALIPPEASLLKELGVSRPTLRESLRVLASKGLIESRQKTGTFVRPVDTWNFLDPDLLDWLGSTKLTDQMVTEIIAFRRLIEPAVAAMAAATASPEHAISISKGFEAMAASQGDTIAYYEADRAFHQAIFDATGNRFVSCLGAVVSTVLDLSFSIQQRSLLKLGDALGLHNAVSRAIGKGAAKEAQEAMLSLLGKAEKELGEALTLPQSKARQKGRGRRS